MNDALKDLKDKFSNLDCTQNSIQKASEAVIIYVKNDKTIMEDIVKLWRHYVLSKSNKLAYLYIANDIIQNSFFKINELGFHEIFFNHISDVFITLYNHVNEKLKREILRMIDIWLERKIYDVQKLEDLKQLLDTNIDIDALSQNPLFLNLIKNNKIKISQKNLEFATIFKEREKFNINKIKTTEPDEVKKQSDLENKMRENLLKYSAEVIKKQNQTTFKHIFYLQEVDKLLDKINSYKKINNGEREDME